MGEKIVNKYNRNFKSYSYLQERQNKFQMIISTAAFGILQRVKTNQSYNSSIQIWEHISVNKHNKIRSYVEEKNYPSKASNQT